MIPYDPELPHAHARIAELERALAGRSDPRKDARGPAVLRGCALAAAILLLGCAIAAGIAGPGRPTIVHLAPVPPPPSVPAGELEPFCPRYLWDADGPALVDVEGKGKGAHDLVLLAWRRGHPERPVHVVALRRGTYEVLWRSEGFPSKRRNDTTSLVATGGKIAVSDALGDVHVLDARTGRELRTTRGPAFARLGTLASDPDAAYTIPSLAYRGVRDDRSYRIDLGTGDVSASQVGAGRFHYECPTDRARACESEPLAPERAKLQRLVDDRAAQFGVDLVDDGDRITYFDIAARPQLVEHQLFAWTADGKALKWKAPVVPKPQHAIQGAGSATQQWLALESHRVLGVYLVGPEGHRLSAHDAATGKLLYDVALPELPYGIEVERLTLDGAAGFITTTGALFVLDATTGKVSTTLRRF